jgi:hypothetical protein
MPPTSEPASGQPLLHGSLSLSAVMPDRDNPLAWKRATQAGAAGARDLLKILTDEEVARYMGVARDQVALEEQGAAIKIGSALLGIGLLVFVGWHITQVGFGRWDIAGLGLAVAMGYWPWRVFKCRRLWLTHFDAARDELALRQVGAERTPI